MDLSTAPLEYAIYAMPENTTLRIKLTQLYIRYKRPDPVGWGDELHLKLRLTVMLGLRRT